MQLNKMTIFFAVTGLALIFSSECFRPSATNFYRSSSVSVVKNAAFLLQPSTEDAIADAIAEMKRALEANNTLLEWRKREIGNVENALKQQSTWDAEATQIFADAIQNNPAEAYEDADWVKRIADASASLAEAYKAVSDPDKAKANVQRVEDFRGHWDYLKKNATAKSVLAEVVKLHPQQALHAHTLNEELDKELPLLGKNAEEEAEAFLQEENPAMNAFNEWRTREKRSDVELKQAKIILAQAIKQTPDTEGQEMTINRALSQLEELHDE